MITATLLALASLSTPATALLPTASYAQDTVRASKGHPSLPARADAGRTSAAPAVCHPDPSKGRACRHHVAKKQEARALERRRAELATADETAPR
ncbi:hypothetical protein [Novosphingobium sp. 9U]|uniref:hypothetical protein n=1 Tax=Novosphingobium sp. 9U TaxID=2653158 RepID=UPI0012F2DC47|nr:hypothetical protein [Novosphingobium sp. 9U]VWX51565.1 conserved exported hypothetical protein [Novosphingobium sp. 9U]